jgi:hypothetical protein
MKKEQYSITRKEYIDPGTARFNILFPGKFEIVQTNNNVIRINYVDYGKYTHKVDYISLVAFNKHVRSGLFVKDDNGKI